MPNRLIAIFTLACVCFLQLACSTTTHTVPPAQVSEWDTHFSGKAGTLIITFKLPQQAVAELFFSDQPIRPKYGTPMRILLDNRNCTLGHQVAIHHRQGNDYFYKYFSQEASWSHSNTLSINWTKNQPMTVKLNNETISVEIPKTFRHLKIVSVSDPITIEKFEYLPQE